MTPAMIDGLAFERQFLDHLVPVWRELNGVAGKLYIVPELRARAGELQVEELDADRLRASSPPPAARPGPGPIAFATSIGDIKVGRRLGYRRFIFMEHGAGQAYLGDRGAFPHPSYAGGADRGDVELFLVPNDYSAALWRAAYPEARVELVGCPRLDELAPRGAGPTTVAISFHWPAFVAPEADTALGHYLGVLRELAGAFNVIGHAHPKGDWPDRMERIYRRAGIPFVAEFDEVLRRADVYVCDNSSTLFEFAATGRPVVVLNSPRYRRHVNHGLRFWEAADVGVQVNEPGELVAGVAAALEDAPDRAAAREAALAIVYPLGSGGGAARAARAIARHLES